MKILADLEPAALQQPGAVRRDGGIKFQCPDCLAEGHDAHRDNAGYFFGTRQFGCAISKAHWRGIGEALGAFKQNGTSPGLTPRETGRDVSSMREVARPGRVAVIIRASTVQPEVMSWLDPGRIGVGALTLEVGLPDQGKTLKACDTAARLSTGSPLAPSTRRPGAADPRRVTILTNEDVLGTTMVPRLLKAGADLDYIDFIQMVRDDDGAVTLLTLDEDIGALEDAMTSSRPALVIIDGIVGYLGADVKSHNDADVRRVLTPFAAMLARTGTAGLGLMHPPKAITNLHYFAAGSIAFTAVPRVVLGVAPDPKDESSNPRRFLAKLKGNLYGRVPTLAYRIVAESDSAIPWIEWEPDPVDVNVADVFDPPKESNEDRGSRRRCEEWLREYLADGPKASREVEGAAIAQGYSTNTLRRVREALCDTVKQGRGGWDWLLKPGKAR